MGIISKTINFIMSVIGFLVFLVIAYVFLYSKWADHQEQQNQEEREELISEMAQSSREKGLGDLDQLRQEYLGRCPTPNMTVLESTESEICNAMADAMLAQSQARQMTVGDFLELQNQLCILEAEQDGEDPDDYCPREYVIEELLNDSLAMGLCALERAWVFDTEYGRSVTKRGEQVYFSHDMRIDCQTGIVHEWDYEGFYEGLTDEDEEWSPALDAVYEAIDSGDGQRIGALLDSHDFGQDPQMDRLILNLIVDYQQTEFLGKVLERTGGQVNFVRDYYDQPLSRAIEADSSEMALQLLDAGASPIHTYEYGATPIVDAASRGLFDVVKRLVAEGADVNGVVGSESMDFGQPLVWSSWNSHEEIALWLLENGATIAPEDPTKFPQWSGDQLLEYAVRGGDLEVIEALVERGATSEDRVRLFEGIMTGGSPAVLAFLFDQGYTLPETKDHDRIYDGVVDVIKEENQGRIEDGVAMFEMLLDYGLDMSHQTDSGWNYAHQAVIHYAPPTVIRDYDNPRDAVVQAHRLRFVKRVIDEVLAAGQDIDHRYETETLLMRAADGGQPELTAYLLELGADASLKDEKGRSALAIAVSEGRRLTAFWDEDDQLKARFTEVVEILGGDAQLLSPQDEP